jgi:hypothetical protein
MRFRRSLSVVGAVALSGASIVGASLVVVGVTASTAGAATFTVDDTADGPPVAANCTDITPGNCSPRDAFLAADGSAGADVIDLAPNTTYQLTECGAPSATTHALKTSDNAALTVNGNGSTIQQTCAAASENGVIQLLNAGLLTVNRITLTGANSTSGVGAIQAGNDASSITVNDSTIRGNTASFQGGVGGAGAITIRNSTISNNTGTVGTGGVNSFNDPVTLINSTVTGNVSGGTGLTDAGGVSATNTVAPFGTVVLIYSTVVGNTGGATGTANIRSAGPLTSFGSVVGDPLGTGTVNCSVGGGTVSNGFNYEQATSTCGFGFGLGDVTSGANPLLGALANNGGPTQTRLPGANSPLLDKILAAACQLDGAAGITTDQRGITRPQGTGCDIGAVEVVVAAPPPPPAALSRNPTFAG